MAEAGEFETNGAWETKQSIVWGAHFLLYEGNHTARHYGLLFKKQPRVIQTFWFVVTEADLFRGVMGGFKSITTIPI